MVIGIWSVAILSSKREGLLALAGLAFIIPGDFALVTRAEVKELLASNAHEIQR